MSETKRVLTGAEVHFKKSVWASLISIGSSVLFGVALYASEGDRLLLLIILVPLAYALADLAWSLQNPLLSIASWKIIHRPRIFAVVEISRAEIISWTAAGKNLLLERQGKKNIKVNLGNLSKDDRQLVAKVLRARGYADLEADTVSDPS